MITYLVWNQLSGIVLSAITYVTLINHSFTLPFSSIAVVSLLQNASRTCHLQGAPFSLPLLNHLVGGKTQPSARTLLHTIVLLIIWLLFIPSKQLSGWAFAATGLKALELASCELFTYLDSSVLLELLLFKQLMAVFSTIRSITDLPAVLSEIYASPELETKVALYIAKNYAVSLVYNYLLINYTPATNSIIVAYIQTLGIILSTRIFPTWGYLPGTFVF
ncbi:uncharacterized protein OGAPODRAFT_12989 [Ogataea polymorpha]|uniref:uncharacterized protein n=1 Tax=Ogataea polymorpha TaxID=460523 RepID=UPI0007F49C01|nr:uncharacterized protein OGAPODRAFT_12989 [Ogataea polymorpha]OBA15503.1 hypothetical protein OGAPODRAFT_12989 [Ogataea polymorpha]